MNNVNKTLYIPLYGKAYVSKKGVILHDEKAEKIWDAEGFELKGKARSKWLAYHMGMRSAVFDQWMKKQMDLDNSAVIIHIGCGMDSRVLRVGTGQHAWYDIDFPDVIRERKRYYKESEEYHMIESDARNNAWIDSLPKKKRDHTHGRCEYVFSDRGAHTIIEAFDQPFSAGDCFDGLLYCFCCESVKV